VRGLGRNRSHRASAGTGADDHDHRPDDDHDKGNDHYAYDNNDKVDNDDTDNDYSADDDEGDDNGTDNDHNTDNDEGDDHRADNDDGAAAAGGLGGVQRSRDAVAVDQLDRLLVDEQPRAVAVSGGLRRAAVHEQRLHAGVGVDVRESVHRLGGAGIAG